MTDQLTWEDPMIVDFGSLLEGKEDSELAGNFNSVSGVDIPPLEIAQAPVQANLDFASQE